MAVADKATENFLLSLNGDNCFPHSSVDLSVFLFQEDSKCIGNHKPEADLVLLDTKIERILRNLR